MNNIVGVSTGSIHTWAKSLNGTLDILRNAKVEAVEVLFGKTTDLDEKISKENIAYLQSLGYVSIHSPFYDSDKNDFYYKNSNIIRRLADIYHQIQAKTIVFHPNLLPNLTLIEDLGANVSLENVPKKRQVPFEELREIFSEYPQFKMVLDTAHAFTYHKGYLDELVQEFNNIIQHVHFSDRRFSQSAQKVKDHQQFLYCRTREKFESIRRLDCPIILEISIKDKVDDLENLKREIASVKRFLY